MPGPSFQLCAVSWSSWSRQAALRQPSHVQTSLRSRTWRPPTSRCSCVPWSPPAAALDWRYRRVLRAHRLPEPRSLSLDPALIYPSLLSLSVCTPTDRILYTNILKPFSTCIYVSWWYPQETHIRCWQNFADHLRSGVIIILVVSARSAIRLTSESLVVGSSLSHIWYTSRECGSTLYMKVSK